MHDIQGEMMLSIGIFMGFLLLAFILFTSISVMINDFEKKLQKFAEVLNNRYDMERKINEQYPSLKPEDPKD